jgi:hypothetical protein
MHCGGTVRQGESGGRNGTQRADESEKRGFNGGCEDNVAIVMMTLIISAAVTSACKAA